VRSRKRRRTLQRLVIVQVLVVAIGITVLLIGFTLAKYLADTPSLRRATLERDRIAVVDALRRNEDPTRRDHYVRYPQAYGLRIFLADSAGLRMVSAINPHLFDPASPSLDRSPDHSAGSYATGELNSVPGEDRWVLTERENIGPRTYLLELVMIGDPAWKWWGVMAEEMVDHVVLPVFTIVPTLALALLLSIGIAVRPLARISREATQLGAAVEAGGTLTPLNDEGLSVEFHEVVSAINSLLAKLEQALSSHKQFTSDAAHELRTPLTVLLLQLAELPPGPTVDSMRDGLEQLAGLIDQLLHLAQAEVAQQTERQPTKVASVARKVCEDLATAAHAQRKTIEFDASDQAPAIAGHAVLIETAIRNVVSNALKHSPARGVVSVSVDAASQVIVADRGPGIRDEHKDLVFARFWRVDRRRSDGAGIGLALVRRIIDLHGGSVRIEDQPGGGTRFILDFSEHLLAGRKVAHQPETAA